MKPNRAHLLLISCVLTLATTSTLAQEPYTFTLGAFAGIGGSLDADPGDDLSNTAFQLTAALLTENKTHLIGRVGHLNLDADVAFGSLSDAGMDYLTIAGEYRFQHHFYESGIYLGLGGYRLDGDSLLTGKAVSDTSFGVVLGLTGEFELTRRLGFAIDLAGHWANLDESQVFVVGQAGIVVHF